MYLQIYPAHIFLIEIISRISRLIEITVAQTTRNTIHFAIISRKQQIACFKSTGIFIH